MNSTTMRWRMVLWGLGVGLGMAGLVVRSAAGASEAPAQTIDVEVRVDASKPGAPLRPIWRFFGADEPNYATMRHGRKLLGELGALAPQAVYFRAHNLLTSGDGTPALKWGSTDAYGEDAEGRPVFNWTILDGIFDAYRAAGVRPYVQMGFMPRDLSIRPSPYQHRWTPTARYEEIYTGWAYPPKDYGLWAMLVNAWVRHCIERYGRAEVEQWYWETWNEANIGYWRGTAAEFHKLHDHAVNAVRRALPTARVGGPDCAGHGGRWMRDFLEHCLRGTNYATGRVGTPLDFVSFHAKGAPVFTNGHVRMGIANHLRTIRDGLALVASYPELKDRPIVIGESDPEGCAACQGPQLGYRNGTMYSSYTAASFARKLDLAALHGVNLVGALTWAFEFEDQPYFAGFRSLASNGLDKPVLNLFRLFERLRGGQLPVVSSGAVPLEALLRDGVRGAPDVSALATADGGGVHLLLWHYHDDDVPGPEAMVRVEIEGLGLAAGTPLMVHEQRIDADHGNAYAAWLRLGSPQSPSPEQYAALEAAARLVEHPGAPATVQDRRAEVVVTVPRQGVVLVSVTWAPAAD